MLVYLNIFKIRLIIFQSLGIQDRMVFSSENNRRIADNCYVNARKTINITSIRDNLTDRRKSRNKEK